MEVPIDNIVFTPAEWMVLKEQATELAGLVRNFHEALETQHVRGVMDTWSDVMLPSAYITGLLNQKANGVMQARMKGKD